MICFRDKTFCCAKTHRTECDRQFTEADEIAAKKWWKGENPPIAWSNFCGGDDRWEDGQ